MTRKSTLFNQLSLVSALFISGCGSAPKARDLQLAVADYNASRYSQAHDRSMKLMRGSVGSLHDQAAYLAGLSAYQLGDMSEAERRWLEAASASNSEASAKSKAMLGQLRLDQKRARDAATLFSQAHGSLSGSDASQCARLAAYAYEETGDSVSARMWNGRSAQAFLSSSSALPDNQGFALQVGAFRDKKRARSAADDVKPVAQRHGLGIVNIIDTKDDRGRRLYLVQFGWFPTRQQAAETRSRIGKLEFIVTPRDSSTS